METRSISHFREPYVKGPHIRYFVTALTIAVCIVLLLFGVMVLMINLFNS